MQIVGILNITPDSYADGGFYMDPEKALVRAGELLSEGADILDIGGESTGPGSVDVTQEEELQRIIPVIDRVRKEFPDARISVDTGKSGVAKEALDRGVMMINDVTAGRNDPAMFSVIAPYAAKLVLMYAKDKTPRTTAEYCEYRDLFGTIRAFLESRIVAAEDAGIVRDRIIIDPGLGHFVSSDPSYSFAVLAQLHRFADMAPVYVSPSRKSFLAGKDKLPVADRLHGTTAASAIAALHGASYIRTHDVLAVRRACEIASAILHESAHF